MDKATTEENEKEIKTPAKEFSGKYYYGTGRRKKSTAQVRLYRGTGKYIVNKRKLNVYFKDTMLQDLVKQPFKITGQKDKFDTSVKTLGGGSKGQADAIRLGISRALVEKNETYKVPLKKAGFLTRDPRKKERKKPGLKKARRAPQWAKR